MNEAISIEVLAEDMRVLYEQLYGGSEWMKEDYLTTRIRYPMEMRHIVRYLVRRERGCRLEDIGAAEAILSGGDPIDHSTIHNSCQEARETLLDKHRITVTKLSFVLDARISGATLPYLGRVAEYKREQDHVKSIVLASLVEFGLVHPAMMTTLFNSYRQLDRPFLEKLLESHEMGKLTNLRKGG